MPVPFGTRIEIGWRLLGLGRAYPNLLKTNTLKYPSNTNNLIELVFGRRFVVAASKDPGTPEPASYYLSTIFKCQTSECSESIHQPRFNIETMSVPFAAVGWKSTKREKNYIIRTSWEPFIAEGNRMLKTLGSNMSRWWWWMGHNGRPRPQPRCRVSAARARARCHRTSQRRHTISPFYFIISTQWKRCKGVGRRQCARRWTARKPFISNLLSQNKIGCKLK